LSDECGFSDPFTSIGPASDSAFSIFYHGERCVGGGDKTNRVVDHGTEALVVAKTTVKAGTAKRVPRNLW
jgi:hypothetical protein